jgi:hypothetical protein
MRKSGAASGLCATRKTQRANEAAAALGAARRRSILVSFSLPLVPSPLSLFLSHTVCADEKVRCCISAREACFLLKEREDEGKEKRQVASVFLGRASRGETQSSGSLARSVAGESSRSLKTHPQSRQAQTRERAHGVSF